jgi:hypothetical protein
VRGMPAEKTSKDSIILALVEKYFPEDVSFERLDDERSRMLPPPVSHAAAAAYVFDILDTLEREQVIRALERELQTIRLGCAEIARMVEARATSHELSNLCRGIGTLLWQVGDLRCVAFGLQNTAMASDLAPGSLNDRSIERFVGMLGRYREVVEAVLAENTDKARVAGRPAEYLPLKHG